MDSLSQIVLGAAVGEAVAGKKLGNKAMFWGAVGGTIPDLDVLVGSLLQDLQVFDEMQGLMFHRGISHSLFFALLAPLFLGRLISWHYRVKGRNWRSFLGSFGVLGLIGFAINFLAFAINDAKVHLGFLFGTLVIGILVGVFLYRRMVLRESKPLHTHDWKTFGWLFLWTIGTHPLLDCFTTYGTQIFQPFSDYAVAFNMVAVADLVYTVPFLLCLLIARWKDTSDVWRKRINTVGIVYSCLYLAFTGWHKYQVEHIVMDSLEEQNITYSRIFTSPALFTNLLWSCIAETEEGFYVGSYSFNDAQKKVKAFQFIPKQHELIEKWKEESTIQTLKRFSKDYFVVFETPDGATRICDLRFGVLGTKGEVTAQDFVFSFELYRDVDNQKLRAKRVENTSREGLFEELYYRTKGIEAYEKFYRGSS